MRISDWSSDVCSSDLVEARRAPVAPAVDADVHAPDGAVAGPGQAADHQRAAPVGHRRLRAGAGDDRLHVHQPGEAPRLAVGQQVGVLRGLLAVVPGRSEEHTSELQSLMRISYAVFCLKKKKHESTTINHTKLNQELIRTV